MFKLVALLAILAVSVRAAYEVTSQDQNILRSYGNLGQISTYSKSIDTPFSSVRKSDVRVSNPGFAVATPVAHAAYPAYPGPFTHAAYSAPVAHAAYPAAVAHAAYPAYSPALAHGPYVAPVAKAVAPGGLLGVAYSAAPSVAHMTFSNGLGVAYEW